jgi:cell wall assembly regulator SMI1
MDPAEGRKVGQIIDFHNEQGPIQVLATGFREWLTQFATDLEGGNLYFDDWGWNIARIES